MIANSFIDIYTTIFSWTLYETLWDTLNGTGLAYIPFIVAIISSLHQSYDQSPSRIVSTLEWNLLGMILVLIFIVIPYQNNNIDLGSVKYDIATTDCNAAAVSGDGDNTGKTADAVFADLAGAGADVRVPIAWALVDYISSSVTYTAIKAMGCSNQYNDVLIDMAGVSIDDPVIIERLDEFNSQCYKPAMADLQENGMPAGNPNRSDLEAWEDMNYLGSTELMNNPGRFYQSPQAYVHQAQRYGFAYSPTPGSLDEQHDEDTFGSTVTCRELWEGRGATPGLKDTLFNSITATDEGDDAWDAWDNYGSQLYGSMTQEQEQDTFLKAVLDANAGNYKSVENISVTSDYAETDWTDPATYINGVTDLVVGGIAAWDGAGTVAQMMVLKKAMKTALPMLVSMAQALVIILAPLAMVWGRYSIDNFVILALAYFGFEFLNAVLQMGYFFESRIAEMSNKAFFGGEIFASLTVYLVSFIQIFLLPTIWLGLVTATGSAALKSTGGAAGNQQGMYGTAGSQGASRLAGQRLKAFGSGVKSGFKGGK